MRIYIPLILSDLAAEQIDVRRVHAVTPALCAAVPDEDAEGYEYMATLAAADDSLRLIGQNPDTERRRVVAVAEVPDTAVAVAVDAQLPTEMDLFSQVRWKNVESFHIDLPGSEDLVERAIAGDEDAFMATGDIELLWFDITERLRLTDH
ncbi:DUF6912 family protein [Arcanobacterium haemolyticum]|uniref:Uncharacterized protein n=1 Tax=Arcanobacterium haemolyticum (strain ATCC 9345 / DSM 20595 / CCM 5947 / CCUG 17215 / LMG 16163 / NBRC 15585 / NCTC 8452 / 11018) TaxID=644284 RepID=D7BMC7_ARCHD|nr:hypothetical protein [Arcanobacterium haemolyticum]ADH92076.1 conserved hypothetical protein [Arcanobacterium haemolyticum DSM 20595]SPT74959.1 Uncharacterised protein [Arcanobacterium haemolyticum]SQH29221.1 Uncharacterised protein [Arcanobacterium haemolyticum]